MTTRWRRRDGSDGLTAPYHVATLDTVDDDDSELTLHERPSVTRSHTHITSHVAHSQQLNTTANDDDADNFYWRFSPRNRRRFCDTYLLETTRIANLTRRWAWQQQILSGHRKLVGEWHDFILRVASHAYGCWTMPELMTTSKMAVAVYSMEDTLMGGNHRSNVGTTVLKLRLVRYIRPFGECTSASIFLLLTFVVDNCGTRLIKDR